MLADVSQMTWFANIKMLLWRFVDKMDGEDGRADPLEQWIWACTVPARRCSGGPQVPESLKAQLKIGGRLVIPVGADRRVRELVRVTRVSENEYRSEDRKR